VSSELAKNLVSILQEKEKINDVQARSILLALAEREITINSLIQKGTAEERDLLEALSRTRNLEIVKAPDVEADRAALALVEGNFARENTILPISIKDDTLTVIMNINGASNLQLQDALKRKVKARRLTILLSMTNDIKKALTRSYRADSEIRKINQEERASIEKMNPPGKVGAINEITTDSRVIKSINLLIDQAITDGASDIHLEQAEHEMITRLRIDGVLHTIETNTTREMSTQIFSYLKLQSQLKIEVTRETQDGRMTRKHPTAGTIDLRVAIIPNVWGEKIVIRILDNSNAKLDLVQLGFSESNLQRFQSAYKKPYGMIIVTGPTGSGKSTTLYAALNDLASTEISVQTIENPVEYRIEGINQTQTTEHLKFATVLKTVLRADPDVILVGEIRDAETAGIAVEAAQTGHLLLSTMHTNDAASAVPRFAKLDVDRDSIGEVVQSVLAQRLVRILCKTCKTPYVPTSEELADFKVELPENGTPPTFYQKVGCDDCAFTGFRGRMGIHEILLMSEGLEEAINSGASVSQIRRIAINEGMTTMKDDGWLKVQKGHTTIDEVKRVVVV
jgi:type IV pilus assembly protein PilB